MKNCNVCNTENEDNALFCTECGNRFDGAEEKPEENRAAEDEKTVADVSREKPADDTSGGKAAEDVSKKQTAENTSKEQPAGGEPRKKEQPGNDPRPVRRRPRPAPNPEAAKGTAIASFVLGIASVVLSPLPFMLIAGIVGLILNKESRQKGPNQLQTPAQILNILGIVFCSIIIVIIIVFVLFGFSLR